jgi:hypothetical protein
MLPELEWLPRWMRSAKRFTTSRGRIRAQCQERVDKGAGQEPPALRFSPVRRRSNGLGLRGRLELQPKLQPNSEGLCGKVGHEKKPRLETGAKLLESDNVRENGSTRMPVKVTL